jgi:hypothetical protein
MYGKIIKKAGAKNLGTFMRDKIETKAIVKTDKWIGYKLLQQDFENLIRLASEEKGGNFPELHRIIMIFKA